MNSFSIIVPVYNVYKYIDKCLKSLVNQTYNNYEIIIVNDGSTDDSYKIIDKYKNKYPKLIKSYKKENGGLCTARNYGIKKAHNDYLIFVDSDDYIETNTLEIINKTLEQKETDILVFNYKAIYCDHIINVNTFNKEIKELDRRYLISVPSACNKVIKRKLFSDNDFMFDENVYYYEDLATIPRLIKYTDKIAYIDDYLYNYFVRGESLTNEKNYKEKMSEDIFYAVNILRKELNRKYKEEIEYLYIEHLLRNAGIRFIDYKKFNKIDEIKEEITKYYSNWQLNKYYKTYYNYKQKIICNLIYKKKFFLLSILRHKIGK